MGPTRSCPCRRPGPTWETFALVKSQGVGMLVVPFPAPGVPVASWSLADTFEKGGASSLPAWSILAVALCPQARPGQALSLSSLGLPIWGGRWVARAGKICPGLSYRDCAVGWGPASHHFLSVSVVMSGNNTVTGSERLGEKPGPRVSFPDASL